MAGPPAAAWTFGPSRVQHHLIQWAVLLGGLAVGLHIYLQAWGLHSLFVLVLWAACAALALHGRRRERLGVLAWDGELWRWSEGEPEPVLHLHCVVDFQRFALLRVRLESGKTIWLWAESLTVNPGWLSFRRAVFTGKTALAQHSDPLL